MLFKIADKLLQYLSALLKQEKRLLVWLFFAALLLRLGLMVYLQTYEKFTQRTFGYEMAVIAQYMTEGYGFAHDYRPSVWMPPLYPFVIFLVFSNFGTYSLSSTVIMLVIQSIASSLTLIPLYFIGKRLFGQMVGLMTAVMWIFHLGALKYSVWAIWSSTFSALGFSLAILLFLRLTDSPSRIRDALLCGLVTGLVALNNPWLVTFVPVACLWLFWRTRTNRKQALRQIGLLLVMAMVVISPWILRHYILFNRFVFIEGRFGINLWLGNQPDVVVDQQTAGLNKWTKIREVYSEEQVDYLWELNEAERNIYLGQIATDYIRANPNVFINYTLQRVYLFWTNSFRSTLHWLFLLLNLMTLLGIILSRRYWRDTLLLVLLFITFPLPYYITVAYTYHFRFPIEGLMLVFVAFVIDFSLELLKPDIKRVIGRLAASPQI